MASWLRKLRYAPRCYAVCTVTRSGSNLLLDGLRATGRAGRPEQFFHHKLEPTYAAKYSLEGADDAAYIRGVVRRSASSNAVFGFKLMGWYLRQFLVRLRQTNAFGRPAVSEIEMLRAAFPRLKFVHLTRENKLRQAISKARATQTGLWKIREGRTETAEPQFDPELIERCLKEARAEEAIWAEFFSRSSLEPLRISYEECCRDYAGAIQSVLDFLNIRLPRDETIGPPVTQKQGDALSDEWERRFAELAAQAGVQAGHLIHV